MALAISLQRLGGLSETCADNDYRFHDGDSIGIDNTSGGMKWLGFNGMNP